MRLLIVHNFYLQPGGEDIVFQEESELLRKNGHHILQYTEDNKRINQSGQISVALQSIWSWETYSKLKKVILDDHPDIVHFHNTFPLISPSAYYACKDLKIPVVQTLHNFRPFCPVAILYRDGAVCEECLNKDFPWPGIRHKCYHDSALQTGVLSVSILTHNLLKTWHKQVDAFIALTQFSRDKFLQAGFPEEKIFIKPNFAWDNKLEEAQRVEKEDFFIYVGRLTQEKGIATLFSAWDTGKIPIFIFGSGELPGMDENENFRRMNFVDRKTILSYMQRAKALIFPSEWYEGFPIVIVEALANSLPVITSDIGSQAEIIRDGYSGLHFRSGDTNDLMAKVEWLLEHPNEQLRMGQNARLEYEKKYTPSRNYEILMEIYQRVLNTEG